MGRSVQSKMKSIEGKATRDKQKNETRKANKRRGESGCARLKRLDAQTEAHTTAAEGTIQQPQHNSSVGFMGKIRSMFRR